jgi:hypothetical protein
MTKLPSAVVSPVASGMAKGALHGRWSHQHGGHRPSAFHA